MLVFEFDKKNAQKAKNAIRKGFEAGGVMLASKDDPLKSITIDDKVQSRGEFKFKTVFVAFKNGQSVQLSVKLSQHKKGDTDKEETAGDVFEVKLSSAPGKYKVLPIKNQDDHEKAIAEIAKAVLANMEKYKKALDAVKVTIPKLKGVSVSHKQRVEALKAQIADIDTQIAAVDKKIESQKEVLAEAIRQAVAKKAKEVADVAAQDVRPVQPALRSSAEIRKELDALSAKDKAYNRLQNEGGEGYERDSIPESLHNEYMAALDREFKQKWTKEYFEEARSAWNSIVAEKSNGGKIALTKKDLESIERRVGENSQDIAKARDMLGIAPPMQQDTKKEMESAKPKIEVKNDSGTNQLWVNGEIAHVFGGRSIKEEIAKLDKDNVTLHGKKAEENRRIRGMLKELMQQSVDAGGASGEGMSGKPELKPATFDSLLAEGKALMASAGLEIETGIRDIKKQIKELEKNPLIPKEYADKIERLQNSSDILRLKELIASDKAWLKKNKGSSDAPQYERDIKVNVKKLKVLNERLEDSIRRVYASIPSSEKDALKQRLSDLASKNREVGSKIIDVLMSASTVSDEEATNFAESVVITPEAARNLAKYQGGVDSLKSQLIKFHKLTNGKITNVKFDYYGDKRGGVFVGSGGRSATVILESSPDRAIVFHELGHVVEYTDKSIKDAAFEFIMSRAASMKLKSMNAVSSGGYRLDEKCLAGDFIDPYIGKLYPNDGVDFNDENGKPLKEFNPTADMIECTEVISMGLERLETPEAAAKFAAQDPEMFAFIVGVCARGKNK